EESKAPSLFSIHVMAIPETATAQDTTVPPTISLITHPPQLTTPSPAPTTIPNTTLIHTLPDFSSLICFDQKVSTLETKLSQLKQADHSAQLLKSVKSQLPTMVDDLLCTRIGYATRTALNLMPQILPKKVSAFATPMIHSTINESLENVVLAKSSFQPKSTYEAAESITEFEFKKILLDKIERNLFSSYGNVFSLKRDHDDKDKDEGPSAGSDRDTEMPQDQGGDTEDQPNVEATPMDDWFKKPNKPPTPDRPWNDGKSIDSRPPQKWISNIAKAR
nr:hypothetical protein [Tanacetum cinerariifolium]